MSYEQDDPLELNTAERYLADVFPDMLVCVELPPETPEMLRGHTAGIGLAEVLRDDGSSLQAYYVTEETKYTRALEYIYGQEAQGLLPTGSHDEALDSIFNGEFDDQWGAYLG